MTNALSYSSSVSLRRDVTPSARPASAEEASRRACAHAAADSFPSLVLFVSLSARPVCTIASLVTRHSAQDDGHEHEHKAFTICLWQGASASLGPMQRGGSRPSGCTCNCGCSQQQTGKEANQSTTFQAAYFQEHEASTCPAKKPMFCLLCQCAHSHLGPVCTCSIRGVSIDALHSRGLSSSVQCLRNLFSRLSDSFHANQNAHSSTLAITAHWATGTGTGTGTSSGTIAAAASSAYPSQALGSLQGYALFSVSIFSTILKFAIADAPTVA